MEFGKAFTYVFEDPDWIKKVLLAAVFAIIPILGTFVTLGWSMDAGQRVIRQTTPALPDVDFGKHLGMGFQAFLVGLVYAIPILVLEIPSIILGVMAANSDTMATVASIVALCCGGLIFLYAIALTVLLPAALGNFLATDQLSAAFRFSEVIGLVRAAPGAYLMVLLGSIITGFITSLGGIACIIGVYATMAYSMAVMGNLYGQAYRASIANGALTI